MNSPDDLPHGGEDIAEICGAILEAVWDNEIAGTFEPLELMEDLPPGVSLAQSVESPASIESCLLITAAGTGLVLDRGDDSGRASCSEARCCTRDNVRVAPIRSPARADTVNRSGGRMKLEHALAIVHTVVGEAGGPISVFVADGHGEVVAAATMDGAAPDTRLNAQRKAYTAARSDALSTRDLAVKVKDQPVERVSFDPFFTFFQGGVAAFDAGRRVGSVGVSGLSGSDDDRLARHAIAQAGLDDGT